MAATEWLLHGKADRLSFRELVTKFGYSSKQAVHYWVQKMQCLTPSFALAREHLAAVAKAAAENTETGKEGCTTAEEPVTGSLVKQVLWKYAFSHCNCLGR